MIVGSIRHHSPRLTYFIIALILSSVLFPGLPVTKATPALAQSPLTAQVDRTTLPVDEQLFLTLTISGEILNLPTPDLSGLTDFGVVGSSEATQVSIIQGKLTSEKRFIYRLQPLREGDLVIPPISVEIDGQLYQTDPINIKVLPGAAPAAPPGEDVPSTAAPHALVGQNFFVEAEVDKPRPFLGQQIIYTFRLYQAANFLGQPDYQPPPFIDFWGQTTLSQPNYRTRAAGRDYLVTEIRTALFPANVGSVTIAPAKFVIPGGLFEPDIVLDTEPVTVNVKSWPAGAPPDFNGAVGQFQMNAHLKETEGKVNEPVTLVLEIQGAGNIEILNEPALPDLPGWRVFDSEVSTTTEVRDDVVYGTRRFERLIVPGKPGRHTLPPISFSYFDPQAETYRTLVSDPLAITIQPGEMESTFGPVAAGSDQPALGLNAGDIRHIKPAVSSLRSAGSSVLKSPLYWSCWILPALVVGAGWVWQRRRRRLLEDSAYARRQRARRVARAVLAEAQSSGVDSYAAVHRALLGYLSDKLNRPTVGLTTDGLVSLLQEYHLDPTLIDRVRATLHQIDIGRFAPIEDAAARLLISDIHTLINDLERSFENRR